MIKIHSGRDGLQQSLIIAGLTRQMTARQPYACEFLNNSYTAIMATVSPQLIRAEQRIVLPRRENQHMRRIIFWKNLSIRTLASLIIFSAPVAAQKQNVSKSGIDSES